MKQILGILLIVCCSFMWSKGQNNALHFDGNGDYIVLPTSLSTDFDGATAFTVEAWVYNEASGGGGFRTIASDHNWGAGTQQRWAYRINNDQFLSLQLWTSSGSQMVTTTTPLPLNTWAHTAVTWDGTTIKLYLNGTVVAQGTHGGSIAGGSTNSPVIGATYYPGATQEWWKGNLDEVRIWDYARCEAELLGQKDCELAGTENGLLGYYNFNQGAAGQPNSGVTTLMDKTSNAYNGMLNGFSLAGTSSNWVDGSGNNVSATVCTPSLPEIDMMGNGQSIALGDMSPTISDDTDFGVVSTTGNKVTSFTIDNTAGGGVLTISSINVSGTNAADFVVSGAPATVAAGNSATFDVTFTPGAIGVRTATITVNNDDCDEATYNFAVQGEGAILGSALNFDGSNDRVDCGVGAQPHNGAFTVEFWTNKTTNNSWDPPVSGRVGTDGWNFYTPGGIPRFVMKDGSLWNKAEGTTVMNLGQWYHIAGVYDGVNKLDIYVNGELETSTILNSGYVYDPTNYVSIGRLQANSSYKYPGSVDEVRIWNVARTCAEIKGYKDCELAGTETGLLAYYNFNQGVAGQPNSGVTTLMDKTSNNNNGTLTGFALTGSSSNWIDGTANAVSATPCTPSLPEIDMMGNGQSIALGDMSPAVSDDTDFGAVLTTGNKVNSFTIDNTVGTGVLTINSINVTGTNAADFVVSGAPTTVAAGNSATFDVTFTPGAAGVRTATITVNNNDCDEATYNFAVEGLAVVPSTLHVDITATGANDGSTWANAYTSLQDALDAANVLAEILIAEGTYLPSKNRMGNPSTGRNATFYINKDVTLKGGYPTGGGTVNPMVNKTILSGDLGTQGNNSDNSYNVIYLENASSSLTLDGLIIEHGNANGTPYPYNRGGGISNNGMNSGNSSPTIQNCIFRWNMGTYGGAISNMSNFNGAVNATITGCLFYENTSTTGSAISNGTYQGGRNSSVISNCTFADNVGTSIHNANGNASIIVQNSIIWDAGAPLYNYGNETTVQNSLVKSNVFSAGTTDGGNNMFAINPAFIDAANDNYGLKAFSAGVDAGSNGLLPAGYTSDLLGGTRTVNTTVDLGAIERAMAPSIIYVNHAASGSNNGSDWTNAYTTLKAGIDAAATGTSIWVAGGTYMPTSNTDRTMSFEVASGVKVYGGFAGGESQLSQRDWATNPTILSGDIGAQGNNSDNSYNVVRMQNADTTTTLDGLIIEGGNADGSPYPYNRGGGLSNNGMNSGNSSPTIQNCIFRWNMGTYGGAISNMSNFNGAVNATITGCLFYENTSTTGSAISNGTYQGGSNNSVITNCTFADNTGTSIHNANGNASIIVQNSIIWDAGAPLYNYANEATVQYCILVSGALPAKTIDGGNNMFATDPMFVDAANDDYKLQGASPAVAAGSNAYLPAGYTLDLAYSTRQNGATVELGCYEDAVSSAKTMASNNNPTAVDENTSAEEEQAIETVIEEELEMSSLEETATVMNMTVYPNPVQDIVNIRLVGIQETVSLQLLNTAGQTIQQEVLDIQEGQTIQLDMSRLANGIYLLNVQLEDGTRLNERVVKF